MKSTTGAPAPETHNEHLAPLILPATFRLDQELHDLDQDKGMDFFLKIELDVSRLNCIHKHLWLAGQQLPVRPLNQQISLGRNIICTEELDLHLLWVDSCIFIKPCPDFLLCYDFWQRYICHDTAIWGIAVGVLLSYTNMVQRNSDLAIAHKEGLLREDVTWQQWVGMTSAIRQTVDVMGLGAINPRFQYRELRLARINWIYRFCSKTRTLTTLVRGYKTEYNDYRSFLQRNIAPITIATVYVVLVLSALQVGLATERLNRSERFQRIAYNLAILAILGPLGALVFLVNVILGFAFVQNLLYTLKLRRAKEEASKYEWSHEVLREFKH